MLRGNIDDVRRRAVAPWPRPDSIKFLTSIEIVTDRTDSAARAKADELAKYHDLEGGLVLLSALSGVDWSTTGWTARSSSSTPMPAVPSSRRSTTRMPPPADVARLCRWFGRIRRPAVRRISTDVADDLDAYAERAGVDGFNIAYHVTPGSFADVAEHLIPELRRRGRARERR